MSRRGRAVVVACVIAIVGAGAACGRDEDPGAERSSPTPTPMLSPTPTPTSTPTSTPTPGARTRPGSGAERSAPELRVARTLGEGASVRQGETIADGRVVVTGEGQEATLVFERGARIDVEAGTRLARSVASVTGVALGAGAVHAILVPEGGSARPALRVATSRGIVEIGGSGDVFVAALPDGAAYVAVLQGMADVSDGALDAAGRLVSTRVVAGRATVVGRGEARLDEGPGTLAAARSAAARLARGRRAGPTMDERRAALDEALGARIRAVEVEAARGPELRARHRAAVEARRSSEELLRHQGDAVAHAQALLRARVAARAVLEQAEALATLAGDDAPARLAALRERAAPALPGSPGPAR